jgi:hypothetical protein
VPAPGLRASKRGAPVSRPRCFPLGPGCMRPHPNPVPRPSWQRPRHAWGCRWDAHLWRPAPCQNACGRHQRGWPRRQPHLGGSGGGMEAGWGAGQGTNESLGLRFAPQQGAAAHAWRESHLPQALQHGVAGGLLRTWTVDEDVEVAGALDHTISCRPQLHACRRWGMHATVGMRDGAACTTGPHCRLVRCTYLSQPSPHEGARLRSHLAGP